jgi:acetyl esterase/lipase
MPSTASRLVGAALRLTRRNRAYVSADEARRLVTRSAVRPGAYGPPARLRRDVAVRAGRDGGHPVYTVVPRDRPPAGAVVYAHGGGWVGEIAPQHWWLVAQLAAEAGAAVTVPIYPLVPFGTAGEVVPWVADLARRAADDHGRVVLAGDSAGGQIVLSAALHLRDRDDDVRPARTILVSPALDLTFSNPEIEDVQPSDPWLGVPGARVLAEHWRGDRSLEDPMVSPLFGDLRGLGPISVHSGTRDVTNPDGRLLVSRARAAGVDVELHERHGLLHVFPLLPTPEGRVGRALIVDEVRAALAG